MARFRAGRSGQGPPQPRCGFEEDSEQFSDRVDRLTQVSGNDRQCAGTGFVRPGDEELTAAHEMSDLSCEDQVSFGVVDGKVDVRHVASPGGA